ncbi:MAG: alpha/beta fold hydrolase [Candidatus Heimdallarchaeota archaeon]|nr:alpha/beta fold hydrolase [Candidatus Heimdallarchaeota archaeon]
MDKDSIYFMDPYRRTDVHTDIFAKEDTWKEFFDEYATISTQYIEVEPEIQILMIKSTPKIENGRPLMIIPGWFSVITAWISILKEISKQNVVYYYETREKTSARHCKKKVTYSIERYAEDFEVVINQLAHPIEEITVLGSSLGGTMLFNYLARFKRHPHCTLLMGPNPFIKLTPVAPILFNLPVSVFIISIRYAIWHMVKFRINKEEEPEQVTKLLQVMRLALPRRMKYSVRHLRKYNAWKHDIEAIDSRVILIGALADKMHGVDRTRRIRDAIKNSGYLEYSSNLGAHSIGFARDMVRLSKGDNSFVEWDNTQS